MILKSSHNELQQPHEYIYFEELVSIHNFQGLTYIQCERSLDLECTKSLTRFIFKLVLISKYNSHTMLSQ